MTATPLHEAVHPRVIVTQLVDERRWVVVCLLCAADRHEPIGWYDQEASARRSRANHVRWHRELLERGAACPTCGQTVSPEVRAAVQLPPLAPGRGAGVPRIDRAQPQLPLDDAPAPEQYRPRTHPPADFGPQVRLPGHDAT